MNIFVERLNELLKLRGYSIYELAEKAGINRGAIYNWYNLDGYPSITTIEKICTVMGITLRQFFYTPKDEQSETDKLLQNWFFLNEKEKGAIFATIEALKSSRRSENGY